MLLNTARSLAQWLLLTVIFCLIVGLLHMFSREVTLDSVRNIDFKLIQDFSTHYDFEQTEDRKRFKLAIGNLSAAEGKAFYPIATVGKGFCIENGSLKNLCAAYPNIGALEAAIDSGEMTEVYGTKILKTAEKNHYYIGELSGHPAWLIGEAGKYLAFPVDSAMRELTFLKNAHYYLLDNRGQSKLWQKNRWIWLFSFLVAIILWTGNFQYRLLIEKKVQNLYKKEDEVEAVISDKNNELTILNLQVDSLKNEIETELSQNELELLQLTLAEAEKNLVMTEEDYLSALVEKDEFEEELTSLRKRLSSIAKAEDIEALSDQLNTLKSLWQKDFNWLERYDVESKIATNNKRRTPFTLFVAFSGLERYLKSTCYRYSIDASDNEGRIEKLFEEGKISGKKKSLLNDARLARNKWLHEGKYPDQVLLNRLLDLLEKENTQPRV